MSQYQKKSRKHAKKTKNQKNSAIQQENKLGQIGMENLILVSKR